MPLPLKILILCLALLSASAFAQEDRLAAAREAIASEDSRSAITALDSLRATGKQSPDLYQALGNAWFEQNKPGMAILNYERGLRLMPGHKGLKNNLKFVRAEAGINALELQEFFLVRWWRSAGAVLGASTCQWLALLFWALAVIGGVTWYLRRRDMDEKKRFALLPSAVAFLLIAGLFFAMGNSRLSWLSNDGEAVLTASSAELRVAPGADATLEETLPEGLKFRILDEFDDFIKISLEDGRQGWIPAAAMERI
ncbi:hypothetical protein [Neolewinella agarilytica]|uniref:hypothetical protein n=1 Tax=Neolewinella agarilytica TaxID=478744 RepID=UPI0023521592|nr:hypothetical protein [Neolewinella agarilytica]